MTAIEPSSKSMPRYMEIVALLRRELAAGKWNPGDRMPTISELADRFNVAPLTARQAVKYMESVGTLECRRGAGTYVAGPVLKLQSIPLNKNADKISGDMSMRTSFQDSESVETSNAALPGELTEATGYQRFRRVYELNDQPAMLSDVYVDQRLYRKAAGDFDAQPALDLVMGILGPQVSLEQHCMTIDMADDAVANHLGLTYLAPVAKIQIVLKDKKDVAVYVAKLYWPAELVRIDFHNF